MLFGWPNNSKRARINNCIFEQQGVLQALHPNSRDGAGIRARGAEHNRLAPARSAVVQPVSFFHRVLFRLRGPNDLLKRTPERRRIVIPPDLTGGFTNARGALDIRQFDLFSGHYLSFKTRGFPTYWRFGGFQWVAEVQIQSNSRISKSRLSGANIDLRPPLCAIHGAQPSWPGLHAGIPVVPHHCRFATGSQYTRRAGHDGKGAPRARRQSNLPRRAHRPSRRPSRPLQNVEQLFPASEAGKPGETAI